MWSSWPTAASTPDTSPIPNTSPTSSAAGVRSIPSRRRSRATWRSTSVRFGELRTLARGTADRHGAHPRRHPDARRPAGTRPRSAYAARPDDARVGIRKTPEQAATDITLLGVADAVVTPSAAARDTLLALGLRGHRFTSIPYGLDETPAKPGARPRAERCSSGCARPVAAWSCASARSASARTRRCSSGRSRLLDRVAAVFIGEGTRRR